MDPGSCGSINRGHSIEELLPGEHVEGIGDVNLEADQSGVLELLRDPGSGGENGGISPARSVSNLGGMQLWLENGLVETEEGLPHYQTKGLTNHERPHTVVFLAQRHNAPTAKMLAQSRWCRGGQENLNEARHDRRETFCCGVIEGQHLSQVVSAKARRARSEAVGAGS